MGTRAIITADLPRTTDKFPGMDFVVGDFCLSLEVIGTNLHYYERNGNMVLKHRCFTPSKRDSAVLYYLTAVQELLTSECGNCSW